jgi:hypothetical protein
MLGLIIQGQKQESHRVLIARAIYCGNSTLKIYATFIGTEGVV